MWESTALAITSVVRRWKRNLISVSVVAVGVGAIIILSSIAVGSSETVSSRLDSATRSELTVLLPGSAWERDEGDLVRPLADNEHITHAGTLVPPDRTAGSVSVTAPHSSQTVESAVGVATPSGLRAAPVSVSSGGIGSDATISSLDDAIYLGSRVARELGYPDVSAGHVSINGQDYAVLGIVSSPNAWISASILFTPASARAAGFLPESRVLTVSSDADVTPELRSWISLTLSPTAPDAVSVLSPPSAKQLRAEILERGTSLTRLIALIAALTGFITLAATTFASLTERRREMGLYLALGYGRRFISGQIVVEGTLVGVLGGVTGLLLGTMIAAAVSAVSFPLFYFPTILVLLPLAAGILGMLSSLLPSLAATRVSPSELLRD